MQNRAAQIRPNNSWAASYPGSESTCSFSVGF